MTKARDLASAAPAPSTVSATEIGYLDGVSSAIQTQIDGKVASSLVDAKGDLLVGSADNTLSRLAVSDNGSTLVADSAASTGLRWQGNYAAAKNKILNSDFSIWQRGTSFSSQTFGTYYADRWVGGADGGGTRTVSQQSFTAGTAPVAGYEGTFFLRVARTVAGSGSTFDVVEQRVEDVRTFANQTVTFSFWGKAASNATISYSPEQVFGSGGSSTVAATGASFNLTTSWQRFTHTTTIPSISGKTIGSGNYFNLRFYLPINTTFTIDIWGVQVEAGSVATAFQTATGTLQGELAACQRYYSTSYKTGAAVPTAGGSGGVGLMFSYPANALTGWKLGTIIFPQRMRTSPTVTIYSYTGATTNMVSDASGADCAANSGTPYLISEFLAYVYNNSGSTIYHSQGGFICHFAASAEL